MPKKRRLLLLFSVVFLQWLVICLCPMEGVFVEWPFLYVVTGSCFFFNGSDNAVLSKKH